jgi:2'-5' RNA ligase
MPSPLPLILTLKFDEHTFAVLDDLRQQHFPPTRNVVPAHITLFHALPGEQEDSIRQPVHALCSATPVLPIVFPQVRSLGRGVAVAVDCPALVRLRQELATAWSHLLGEQDRRPYRPHVTIQNKVAHSEAQRLYHRLAATWSPFGGRGEGLMLWRYLGGPWELVDEFAFVNVSPEL